MVLLEFAKVNALSVSFGLTIWFTSKRMQVDVFRTGLVVLEVFNELFDSFFGDNFFIETDRV